MTNDTNCECMTVRRRHDVHVEFCGKDGGEVFRDEVAASSNPWER